MWYVEAAARLLMNYNNKDYQKLVNWIQASLKIFDGWLADDPFYAKSSDIGLQITLLTMLAKIKFEKDNTLVNLYIHYITVFTTAYKFHNDYDIANIDFIESFFHFIDDKKIKTGMQKKITSEVITLVDQNELGFLLAFNPQHFLDTIVDKSLLRLLSFLLVLEIGVYKSRRQNDSVERLSGLLDLIREEQKNTGNDHSFHIANFYKNHIASKDTLKTASSSSNVLASGKEEIRAIEKSLLGKKYADIDILSKFITCFDGGEEEFFTHVFNKIIELGGKNDKNLSNIITARNIFISYKGLKKEIEKFIKQNYNVREEKIDASLEVIETLQNDIKKVIDCDNEVSFFCQYMNLIRQVLFDDKIMLINRKASLQGKNNENGDDMYKEKNNSPFRLWKKAPGEKKDTKFCVTLRQRSLTG